MASSRFLPLLTVVGLALSAQPAGATLLDPSAFTALGSFPSLAGSYTIDTTTLAFKDSGNKTLFAGVNSGGIAVFTFAGGASSSINITARGSLPLALAPERRETIQHRPQAAVADPAGARAVRVPPPEG